VSTPEEKLTRPPKAIPTPFLTGLVASPWDRLVAFGIDIGLIAFVCLFFSSGSERQTIWVLIAGSYFTLLHGAYGATLGKRALRMRVRRFDGGRLGYVRSLVRFAAAGLSLAVLTGGFWMAFADERRRTLHDWLSGSVVVRLGYLETERKPRSEAVAYVGVWVRACALVMDVLIVITLFCTSWLFLFMVTKDWKLDDFSMPGDQYLLLAIGLLYNTLFVGFYGATPGKMAFEVSVVRKSGQPVGFKLAFLRCLVVWWKFLLFDYFALPDNSGMASILWMMGWGVAAFDPQKRALQDRICGTRVIHLD
jgi:uncharacterized RDD family membrane protein YckC